MLFPEYKPYPIYLPNIPPQHTLCLITNVAQKLTNYFDIVLQFWNKWKSNKNN